MLYILLGIIWVITYDQIRQDELSILENKFGVQLVIDQ